MYEPVPQDERPGCRETLVITRVVFSIVLPVVFAGLAIVVALGLALVLYDIHAALALLPVGGVVAGIYVFARWERGRFRGGSG
ncbi:MAG: hypothetical protein WD939_03150 [Dehalococcoidia bacterium]